ncbi:GtrA family protein, partial [Pseudophaeobacter leonis]|uniref:GtrA family protein n=1 Tax=Pseudophaeobacter leonis TaxID=1144477 RepID=UPI00156EEAFE
AFFLSFTGHQLFTFQGHGSPVSRSLLRYSITAATGFGLNQMLLYVLHVIFHLPPLLSLVISTGVSAVGGFILSKVWAFRGQGARAAS